MSRVIILNATSPHEVEITAKMKALFWKNFMSYRWSQHSGQACTLPYMIRRAEREGIAYELRAMPGKHYALRRAKINEWC